MRDGMVDHTGTTALHALALISFLLMEKNK